MKTKQYAALAVLAVAAGAFIAFNPYAQSKPGNSQAYKLEGAWVAKVPGMPMQWTYTLVPDPSGRSAAMSGSIQIEIRPSVVNPALFPDWEYSSPLVGELVMTGNNTAKFTAVWYGMKKGFPFDQVVYIGVNSGEATFTGPGKSVVTHNLGFYAPSADADGDGLPDPGQAAALCLPSMSIDTRVLLMPPCAPALQ
jgi:hypothetical protein